MASIRNTRNHRSITEAYTEVSTSPTTTSQEEDRIEALVKLIRDTTISTQAKKAALIAIYSLISSSEKAASSRFAEMGLVPLLIETIVDSDRSMCEKALVVFNGMCISEKGREQARSNALTVPTLVKKMFRVSDTATDFVVSALWKLCKKEEGGGEVCCVEAMQVGAFQKLLLLLQVGCRESTKEKATHLLKMMNGFKGRLDCIDTSDFRGGLKRQF